MEKVKVPWKPLKVHFYPDMLTWKCKSWSRVTALTSRRFQGIRTHWIRKCKRSKMRWEPIQSLCGRGRRKLHGRRVRILRCSSHQIVTSCISCRIRTMITANHVVAQLLIQFKPVIKSSIKQVIRSMAAIMLVNSRILLTVSTPVLARAIQEFKHDTSVTSQRVMRASQVTRLSFSLSLPNLLRNEVVQLENYQKL